MCKSFGRDFWLFVLWFWQIVIPTNAIYVGLSPLCTKIYRVRQLQFAQIGLHLLFFYDAVLELEAARVKSQRSRLQSSRVRKAFNEALAKNREKWRLEDRENRSPRDDLVCFVFVVLRVDTRCSVIIVIQKMAIC